MRESRKGSMGSGARGWGGIVGAGGGCARAST